MPEVGSAGLKSKTGGLSSSSHHHHQHIHHRSESSSGASWHPSHSKLLGGFGESVGASSIGGSLGSSAPGGAAGWANGVVQEHKKKRQFRHIPSRSVDFGSSGAPAVQDMFSTGGDGLANGGASGSGGIGEGTGGAAAAAAAAGAVAAAAVAGAAVGAGAGAGAGANATVRSSRSGSRASSNAAALSPERVFGDSRSGSVSGLLSASTGAAATTAGELEAAGSKDVDGAAGEGSSSPSNLDRKGGDEGGGEGEWGAGEGERGMDEGDESKHSGEPVEKEQSKLEATDINTPGNVSTPGSKRRLVTEVIGDDDVDVSKPQDMDEGEVRRSA